jgi:hypothetical protein
MNIATQTISVDDKTLNKEQFWKKHTKLQKESGDSMMAYCRNHQLNYDQFCYWKQKWQQQTRSAKLLPIHLNKTPKTNSCLQLDTLCTLIFKNGHELKVHDQTILPMLLSLWG